MDDDTIFSMLRRAANRGSGYSLDFDEVTEINAIVGHLNNLLKLEWLDDENYPSYCPWCLNYERTGHADNCPRQAAIKALSGTNA